MSVPVVPSGYTPQDVEIDVTVGERTITVRGFAP